MSTLVYLYGISSGGFRVPDNTGALTRLKSGTIVQVDVDDDKTQKILMGEKDSFIKVAAANSTTAAIVGLDRRGFRITNSAGAEKVCKVGAAPITVTLADRKLQRTLRRNGYGVWAAAASASALAVRGLQESNLGFAVGGAETFTLTSDNSGDATTAKTVRIAGSTDRTYTLKTALTETKAHQTVTTSGTGAANNDTLVVNGRTYTFKTTLTGAADEVLRDGTIDHDLANLKAAINNEAGAGTTYGTGTVVNAVVTCGVIGHVATLTAKTLGVAGNAYTLVRTGTLLSVGGATFAGGLDPVLGEVLLSGSADGTLTNLAAAVSAGAGAGTNYATGTVVNADVSVSAVASHALTFTAKALGGLNFTLTTNEPTYKFSSIVGGAALVYKGHTVTVDATAAANWTQLRRHFKSWIEV